MDVVVNLALGVLGVVFLFSLFILIIMCKRKWEYKRLMVSQSLRFSKLRHDQFDDVIQLSPYISQTLNSNQWVQDVSGLLQHAVAVLKGAHMITDKLTKVPLNQLSPQMNDIICHSTSLVVPRFDDLLRSLASPNVDIRLIEARTALLVTTIWSLVSPFYLLNPKYKEVFGKLLSEMEVHSKFLQNAVQQAEFIASNADEPSSGEGPSTREVVQQPAAPKQLIKESKQLNSNQTVLSKNKIEETKELLKENEESPPVDPSIS